MVKNFLEDVGAILMMASCLVWIVSGISVVTLWFACQESAVYLFMLKINVASVLLFTTMFLLGAAFATKQGAADRA